MRLLDVGILAEVFSSFRCTECIGTLALYEEKWSHGWQTFFRVKCNTCDKELATFPSSRSLDILNPHTCVNVPFTPRDMNEVTMRSVLAVHSTGMSWRNLHKLSTVFDMPPPVQNMPFSFLNRLEAVTAAGVVTAMSDAAKQLHQRVDCEPSVHDGQTTSRTLMLYCSFSLLTRQSTSHRDDSEVRSPKLSW